MAEKEIREARREKRKKIHMSKRKGRLDFRTNRTGKRKQTFQLSQHNLIVKYFFTIAHGYFKLVLILKYAKFKRRASGGLHTYVVPVCIRLSSRALARFFYFERK